MKTRPDRPVSVPRGPRKITVAGSAVRAGTRTVASFASAMLGVEPVRGATLVPAVHRAKKAKTKAARKKLARR